MCIFTACHNLSLEIGTRTMKSIIFLCFFIGITLGAPGKNNPTFEEFEEEFNHIFADPEKEKADCPS